MVQYTSQHQLKIEEFGNLYQMKLDPDNRWIQLAAHFPWDECAKIYSRHFPESGRTAIDPRIVIGLGLGTGVKAVKVTWPDGGEETFPPPPLGIYAALRQGTSAAQKQ